MTTKNDSIRFLDTSVKKGNHSARVHYSINNRADGQNGVTVYAKEYGNELSPIFGGDDVANATDMMTDYFEKDRVFIPEGHPLHAACLKRAESKRKKDEERWAKTQARRAERAAEKQAAHEKEMAEFRARIAERKAARAS